MGFAFKKKNKKRDWSIDLNFKLSCLFFFIKKNLLNLLHHTRGARGVGIDIGGGELHLDK